MLMIYVWICAIATCVISAHAGIIKRPVSYRTHKCMYIPIEGQINDTWIPIPPKAFQNHSALRKHFKWVSNAVMCNDTQLPSYPKPKVDSMIPFIMCVSIMVILVGLGIVFLIVRLMQNLKRRGIYRFHHG